ncbi:hypothetical protein QBC43DRAFT_223731, partial [Cladorrhinum sp. PSN259]
LVTLVEIISIAGYIIMPFVILPGVNIKVKYIDNIFDNRAVFAISPNGYLDDELALY